MAALVGHSVLTRAVGDEAPATALLMEGESSDR